MYSEVSPKASSEKGRGTFKKQTSLALMLNMSLAETNPDIDKQDTTLVSKRNIPQLYRPVLVLDRGCAAGTGFLLNGCD